MTIFGEYFLSVCFPFFISSILLSRLKMFWELNLLHTLLCGDSVIQLTNKLINFLTAFKDNSLIPDFVLCNKFNW